MVRWVEQTAQKSELGLTFGDRYNNIDANIDEGDDIDAFTNNPDNEESTRVNDDIQLEDNGGFWMVQYLKNYKSYSIYDRAPRFAPTTRKIPKVTRFGGSLHSSQNT